MKVVMDGVVFENSHQRGVQRYIREMVDHLPDGVEVDLLLGGRARAALPARARRTRLPPGPLMPVRALARAARRRKERTADVFHSSYFTLPATGIPTVV